MGFTRDSFRRTNLQNNSLGGKLLLRYNLGDQCNSSLGDDIVDSELEDITDRMVMSQELLDRWRKEQTKKQHGRHHPSFRNLFERFSFKKKRLAVWKSTNSLSATDYEEVHNKLSSEAHILKSFVSFNFFMLL